MTRPDVLLILVALHTPTRDLSRYVMEPDEILTRASLCLPTRTIPVPCPNRSRRRR